MKNTLIPLSIAFMDEKGRILNILEMRRLTEENYFSAGNAMFALEMESGWYSAHSVRAGDRAEGVLNAPKGE
jgi:uncharacterized membrane protein (UPF0127 family)